MSRETTSESNDRKAHLILNKMVELYNQLEQANKSEDSDAIGYIRERIEEERRDLNILKKEEGLLPF